MNAIAPTQAILATLDEDQRMIVETAEAFARDELRPNSAKWDKEGKLPKEMLDQLGALGFLGMTIPAEHNGVETDYVTYALALMEIAAGDAATSVVMSVHNSPACAVYNMYGNEDQKQRFLKPMAMGEMIGAFALTEPGAGSDASNLKTKAVKVDGGWKISGSKQFISNGSIAGNTVVFAVTDPASGKKGITAFAVPTNTEGYVVSRLEDKLGIKASDTAALSFDEMFVPDDAVIGGLGMGYKIALSTLESGRIGIGAQSVGIAMEAVNRALEYARERKAFDMPIFELQAVQFRLVDAATRLEAARQMVLHAARLKNAGLPCIREACMAKLFASEVAETIVSECLQVLGGYGYLHDYELERLHRDVRICKIYEGTSDIQKIIIARNL
ncbi:MAG TPA: acyl-CoA dehydrogenase [Alphaproteobacteria bacterium]|jgi:Acyl-CoA dehydrogenases|nr:acyl-CoA dehydrogenase [Paracoccaceae bacterium]RCL81082.1 MAG: acyl-CoA dehydrogenase [SAR116 cluster bacterium]RPH13803.1 MAG: acyl-CoA dehydrogenase [Alphaproteobacteria bacterium TMED150]HCY48483.1 acyl-CoA dehydrogenase [Alphaproteobacteria bacterium]|tara:strand:- start:264 stop:1424 length:1161 start_codon:yes stop_codon:yes gene_type:complete